ncbi:hypothetical protein GY26_11025 [Gammaproteobacteria bacterium MFB021]|nr:hypothetical protein GY26_11025 [Gammaproteobacteria bacterium MFB021]
MTLCRRLATIVDLLAQPGAGCRPRGWRGLAGAHAHDGRSPMQEINPINNLIKDLSERTDVLRGYL